MRSTVLRVSENPLARRTWRRTMLVEALRVTGCKSESSSPTLAPEVIGVRVDLADIVVDARMEVRATVGVLELQDVLREVAILTADFEGDSVVRIRGVRLRMSTSVGCKVLKLVATCRLTGMGLVAAEENYRKRARVANVGLSDTGSFDSIDSRVGASFRGPDVVEKDLIVSWV